MSCWMSAARELPARCAAQLSTLDLMHHTHHPPLLLLYLSPFHAHQHLQSSNPRMIKVPGLKRIHTAHGISGLAGSL